MLTLSLRRSISYRKQSIDLLCNCQSRRWVKKVTRFYQTHFYQHLWFFSDGVDFLFDKQYSLKCIFSVQWLYIATFLCLKLHSTAKSLKQSIFARLTRIHFSLVNNYNDTVTNHWINNIKLTLFLTHSLFFWSFYRQTKLSFFQSNSSGRMEA